MTFELQKLEHGNLSNVVYAALCDSLIKGKFRPGDRIKIRDLAEQLGTSVTPVRDAILRLTHDEALVLQSARDIRIPRMTQARYLELRSIRLRLEALAAETAAQLATPEDMRALEDLLRSNVEAVETENRLLGTELNQAFHFRLSTIARMPMLQGILRRTWLQMGPVIADVYIDGGRSMIDYHFPVVEAIKRHDSDAAAKAIMDDIIHGGQAILQLFKEEPLLDAI